MFLHTTLPCSLQCLHMRTLEHVSLYWQYTGAAGGLSLLQHHMSGTLRST